MVDMSKDDLVFYQMLLYLPGRFCFVIMAIKI